MTPEQYLVHLRAVYQALELPLTLMPAATEQELSTLAQALGPIDAHLAALWRITQGSDPNNAQPMFQRPGFVDKLDFLTPAQALKQAQSMQKRAQRMWDLAGPASEDERLTDRWWQTGWLPFASFYGDIVLLLDHRPGPLGRAGQVIAFVHDPDQMHWIAPSLPEFFQASAHSIDQDREDFLLDLLDEL